MKVFFLSYLLSAPASPQRTTSRGYSDGERGQWDGHRGLLATPSRGGAEWGGPGVQGNKKTYKTTAATSGWNKWDWYCRHTKETQTGKAARSLEIRETETMCRHGKDNEFQVEAHLCTLLGALPLCDDRHWERAGD